jgi:hypothetical protein
VPETFSLDLPSEHGMLLGTALALHRAPTTARAALESRLVNWWRGTARAAPEADGDGSTTSTDVRVYDAETPASVIDDAPPGRAPATERRGEAAVSDAGSERSAEQAATSGDSASEGASVKTALGGAIFLVHVVRALRLDTRPTPDAPWGAWGWVELLARAFLNDSFAEYQADPLWSVLARLDGRDLGSALGPPLAVRPESNALERWLRRLGAAASIVPPGGHRSATVAVTLARRRIAGALGLPGRLTHDDLTRTLLRRDATIIASGANVDVLFALRDARADVRLAGLDADPGWQPAFGRVIRFHYLDAADS